MIKGQGFVKKVTLETLPLFKPLLEEEKEKRVTASKVRRPSVGLKKHKQWEKVQALFAGHKIALKTRPSVKSKPTKRKTSTRVKKKSPLDGQTVRWQKVLAKSDVGRQKGNPTGGVRLTQAGWKVQNQLIDWTSYFRKDLFGNLPWSLARTNPPVEQTSVHFRVFILGQDFGNVELRVSNKPSGEADQHNYTSMLHWGETLGEVTREKDLTAKTLTFYGPLENDPPVFGLSVE